LEPQNRNLETDGEIEVDLRDVFHTVIKWWWMIAIIMIISSTAAYFYTMYTYVPTYTANATMIVNSKQLKIGVSGQEVNVDNNVTLSRTIADSYAVIMKSDRMMELVAKDLGLDLPPSAIRSMVSIAPTVKNTEVLSILVHSTDPEIAAKIANSIMKMAPDIISSTVEVGSIKVVDYAKIPRYPTPPKTALNTAIAAVLGLMLGVLLAFLIKFFDKSIKNSDDIQRLGFTSLGGVPFVPPRKKNGKILSPFVNSDWVGFGFVESYKVLRTNLQFTSALHGARTLLVASSLNREGKTTIALNLAMVLAQSGKRVLLADCDLRKPNIHRRLGLEVEVCKSLTSVLVGEADAHECIIHLELTGIDILPNRFIPPNPSELLESENMKNLLASLAQEYDWVILDTPPAHLVTDAITLSKYTDGVIMVVKQGYVAEDVIRSTKTAFDNVGARIIGCILNAIKYKEAGVGYKYQYYDMYYNNYYKTQALAAEGDSVVESALRNKKSLTIPRLLRKSGIGWVFTSMTITGLLLMSFALWGYLTPLYQTAKLFVQPAGVNPVMSTTQSQSAANSKPYPQFGAQYATLLIPSIEIHTPVFFGDTREQLMKGVGHYSGSYFPGEGGSIIYGGHNNTVFYNLQNIKIGDEVLVQTNFGNFRYKVYDVQIINKDALEYITPSKEKEVLIMYTCYPFYRLGFKSDRYVVFASPVAAPAPVPDTTPAIVDAPANAAPNKGGK